MNNKILLSALFCTVAVFWTPVVRAQTKKEIIISVNKPIAVVQPTMWGIFFEDINFGADGGLYAEMVKNRSFEFAVPLMGWEVHQNTFKEGSVLVLNREKENTANPRFIRVTKNDSLDTLTLTNEGFRGMGIKKGLRYDFSVLCRQQQPGMQLQIELLNATGKIIGSTTLTPSASGHDWKKVAASFIAGDTAWKGQLRIVFKGSGVLDLDMISLFPSDTWKNRPGGLRADMVQLLADMKPGFIRFPGGCIVEGRDLATRYQWKKTIGPLEERQLIINRWNTEVADRPTPDYFQSFGLGFFEYFQLAEDMGAEPLPILNCGMACQFNTAEAVSMNQLDPFVQDALDLIEFANGDVASKWGQVRATLGHPAPFHLKMIGVGNENWGPQYMERLQLFSKALRATYPDVKIVCSSGTDPSGDRFDYLNGELRKLKADLIDEHYYRSTAWFLENARRYDNYPRNGPKIFAGEYAAQSDQKVNGYCKNNMATAIAEAAFMTGLERNAAVVNMASYAPLFAHAEAWQCPVNLIWVNNLQSYGTPDYYVQKLFSTNKGTSVVPALQAGSPVTGQDSLYVSAVIDGHAKEVIIKLVNASGKKMVNRIALEGAINHPSRGMVTTLQSNDLNAANSFDEPMLISPKESEVGIRGNHLTVTSMPYSFAVIRIKLE